MLISAGPVANYRDVPDSLFLRLPERDLIIFGHMQRIAAQFVGDHVHLVEQVIHGLLGHVQLRQVDQMIAKAVPTFTQWREQMRIGAVRQPVPDIRPAVAAAAVAVVSAAVRADYF